MRTSPCSYNGMVVSPCTAWCAAYARPSPRHASPWSCRRATGAPRRTAAGTLVRVLAPPVKAGISQGRQARRATASYHAICGARYSVPYRVSPLYVQASPRHVSDSIASAKIGRTVAAKCCAGVVRRRLWRGYPGNHRVQLYPGSFCHLMVEVTLPTLYRLCHHEDGVAQAIGCIVNRLAPALRVRPPGTVTRFKRRHDECCHRIHAGSIRPRGAGPWGVLTFRERTRERGSRILVLNQLSYNRGGTTDDCLSGRIRARAGVG